KTIEKEDKNLKKDSVTINGIEYTNVVENQVTSGGMYIDKTFMNNCTLGGRATVFSASSYINNSICNSAVASMDVLHINNSVLNNGASFISGQTYIYNTTMKGSIENSGTLIIDDYTIIDPDATVTNTGTVISNNTNVCYIMGYFNLEDGVLSDISIDKPITNDGQLTLKNVTINSIIKNSNKLIISDDCIFTDNFKLTGNGDVISNLTLSDDVFNATKIVEVNNANELNKLLQNNGDLYKDEYYDTYIINCNEGTYNGLTQFIKSSGYTKEIIINGNNQTLSGPSFVNSCNNTLNQATITSLNVGGQGTAASIPTTTLTLNNVVVTGTITVYANGILTLSNCTIQSNINNKGKLIISDDTIFDSNANLTSSGTLLTNNTNLLFPYKDEFNGGTLKDMTIDKDIITNGNFTLQNVTVDKTIKNNGRLIIGDDVIFTENGKIIGMGEIVTDNITNLLPYTETINGNYTISDVTLDKKYNFNGNITLDTCNITSTENVNYGLLNIKNSNINVDDESTWITNYDVLIIENSYTTGNIANHREVYIDNLPEDYNYDNTYHVVNNDTAPLYFDINNGNTLSDAVNEGDTLDFQGTISGIPGLGSLVINKPINIITSTNDGRIENFSTITYNNGASGSNITGLYTYNTQFYVRNAHNMVFDNISNVVISKGIGWGVGQTSIRENSTNITVKNSYFYTKDNGGSSTFVFGWADNCTLVNSTVEADGNVGNLVYLTTYNVDVPSGTIANSNNQILNNIIIGPETPAGICWGIVLSGANNYIANNIIYYKGTGITNQWGSGITGQGEDNNETSLVTTENNTLHNNTHIKNKPQPELTIDTNTFMAGETATITATIRNATKIMTDINKGKVTFKVNGKTLKDENGKVIYVKVVNGTAQIENYLVPDDWTKDGTTIEAVYAGSTQCAKLTSEKTSMTVTPKELTLTTEDITAQAGSTVTLTAILSDNTINTGKVVFKINGKTVKDANGKVIYAKVVNGQVTVNYTIAESIKDGNYNITAVYTSPNSEKVTAEATLTLTKE
ncbi:MAG: Ig-like domain-containing protein, partial [Methanosphaera sp.]|nr:Ig-like domain-containing protein [Methanosphaera sp.]